MYFSRPRKHVQGILAQYILRGLNAALLPAIYTAGRAVKATAARPRHANGGGPGSLRRPPLCPSLEGRGAPDAQNPELCP
eukprot:5463449-Pleurochrysis_carterae.AAC.1